MPGYEENAMLQEASKKRSRQSKAVGKCPGCHRANMKLRNTVDARGIAVAICAYSSIAPQLEGEWVGENCDTKCFSVCSTCYDWSKQATEWANGHFKGEVSSFSVKLNVAKARILKSPLHCGEHHNLVYCVATMPLLQNILLIKFE
jgi:hypothetical protein